MPHDPDSHPTSDEDLFDAWLDAMVTGESTPVPGAPAGSSSVHPFDRVTSAARQFHGLAHAADATPRRSAPRPSQEKPMQNSIPSSAPVFAWPKPDTRPVVTFQAWASYALVAIVVAGLTLGIGRATDFFQSSTPPPVEETTIPFQGVFNIDGTPVPMGESSSIPYPNELNCTIEPLTRDEVVAHLQAANNATEPVYPSYPAAIVPSNEDAQAIMDTYRMWQACSLGGRSLSYVIQLMSPWHLVESGLAGFFRDPQTYEVVHPVSDDMIQAYADIAMMTDEEIILAYPPSTPTQEELDAYATQGANEQATYEARIVPLPDGATPVAAPAGGGFSPTIFATDIQIVGPDVATATAVFVNQETGEVSTNGDMTLRFIKVNGVWLIDYQYSGPKG
jgi:hypothetical protein